MDLWFWGSPMSRNYFYVIVMYYSVFFYDLPIKYHDHPNCSNQNYKNHYFLSSLPPLWKSAILKKPPKISHHLPLIFHIHWAFQVFGLLLMVASHFLRLNYHKKLIFHPYSTSYSITWICLRNHQQIKHFFYNFPKYLNVPLGKTNPLQQIQDS